MKKSAFVIASLLATGVMAAEPNYNFVQGSLLKAEEITLLPGVDVNLEGYAFDFSHELTDQVFGFASYSMLDDKVLGVKVDVSQLQAGLGFRMPLAQNTDVFTSAALVRESYDMSGYGEQEDDSENGYALALGIRSLVADSIELSASYTHQDMDGSDNFITVSGQYFLNKNFSLGLSHVDNDDMDVNSVFVRYNF